MDQIWLKYVSIFQVSKQKLGLLKNKYIILQSGPNFYPQRKQNGLLLVLWRQDNTIPIPW